MLLQVCLNCSIQESRNDPLGVYSGFVSQMRFNGLSNGGSPSGVQRLQIRLGIVRKTDLETHLNDLASFLAIIKAIFS